MPAPTDAALRAIPTLAECMRAGNVFEADCPSREILRDVTSRWGVLVLLVLLEGPQRFSHLRRRIRGVSEKMLSQTLQALAANGFLQRVSHPVIPPHVEYSLTPSGRHVAAHVEALTSWIEDNLGEIMRARRAAPSID